MARQEPLTEREVREALGLSHRAASLALAEAESWGIVERVPEPRRVGRRGPAGTAYLAVGDHWQWFGRVIAERKVREGDPIVAVLEAKEVEAAEAAKANPADTELASLRDWLAAFLVFVRLFDRAVGLVPQLEPRELERSLGLLGRDPGHDDPAPVRPARRAARRRRHRPGRGAVTPVADRRAPCHEADVGGRPHRRALASGHDRTTGRPAARPRLRHPRVDWKGIARLVVGARAARSRAIVYWIATADADGDAAPDPDLGRLGRRPLVRRRRPDALAAQPAGQPAAGRQGRVRQGGRDRRGHGPRARRPGRAAGLAHPRRLRASTRRPRATRPTPPTGRRAASGS